MAPKYTSFPPLWDGSVHYDFILGPVEALFEIQKYHHCREINFHWTGQNVIIFGTSLTQSNGSPNKNHDMRTGLHSIAWDTIVFPPLLRCRHGAIPGKWIDWLTLFELDRVSLNIWSSDKRSLILWSTWMGLCSWNFSSFPKFWTRHFLPGRALPSYPLPHMVPLEQVLSQRLKGRVIVVPVPLMEVQVLMWAIQVKEAKSLHLFYFCSLCVTCVRQQRLGHGQDAHKRNSGIRKKLYRKSWSMMNMHGAWWHPLYVHKKVTAVCWDHTDGTAVHVHREIMLERVLKLVRGLYANPPDTPYLGQKWW